jgi:hypothetical protein
MRLALRLHEMGARTRLLVFGERTWRTHLFHQVPAYDPAPTVSSSDRVLHCAKMTAWVSPSPRSTFERKCQMACAHFPIHQ